MASTDIDGSPILIVSRDEAQQIVAVFEAVFTFGIGRDIPIYLKAKQFLEECDDNNDSPSDRVYQKRFWPE